MKLKINKDHLSEIDFTHLIKYVAWAPVEGYFPQRAGVNHHRLFAYLSAQLKDGDLIADLGTYVGSSALSLSYNPKVNVRTYDVSNYTIPNQLTFLDIPNIIFIQKDCLECIDEYITAKIILVDIAPHDSVQERTLIEKLIEKNYQGILILDDIYYNDEMRQLWKDIGIKKIDATEYGHHSGTGIVIFNEHILDVEVVI